MSLRDVAKIATFIPSWRVLRRNVASSALLERLSDVAAMRSTFAMRVAPMPGPRFLPARVLPPETAWRGASPSQLTKCFSLGNADKYAPISVKIVRAVRAEPVDARQIHRRIAVQRPARRLFSPHPDGPLLGWVGVP